MSSPETIEWAEESYATYGDFWQVTTNPRRMVRDRAVLDLVRGMRFGTVVDFACGLGVVARLLARQAEHVIGIDGAPTAVASAQQLSASFSNVEYLLGSWQRLASVLETRSPDLLVCTDSWSFFTREEQRQLLALAEANQVRHCLFEIRIADKGGARDVNFIEGVDFETPSAIENCLTNTDYSIERVGVSRLYSYKDTGRRAAYSQAACRRAIRARRWWVDAPTALLGIPLRLFRAQHYDAWVLYRRMRWCTAWYRLHFLRPVIEPVVAGIALLLRRKGVDDFVAGA